MIRLRGLFAICLLFAFVGAAGFLSFDSSPVLAATDKTHQPDLLDLNTYTVGQLKALSRIADGYSEKLNKGRPYSREDELVQKKILPRAAYEQIKYKIEAKQK